MLGQEGSRSRWVLMQMRMVSHRVLVTGSTATLDHSRPTLSRREMSPKTDPHHYLPIFEDCKRGGLFSMIH